MKVVKFLGFQPKVGRVFSMVAASVLPNEVFGRNDHREDAPHYHSIILICLGVKSNLHNHKFGQNSLDRIVVRCLLGEPCPKYRKSSKYI